VGDYRLAICSAGRPDTVARKTLRTLHSGGVDTSRVTVYVPDEMAAENYAHTVRPFGCKIDVVAHDPSDGGLDRLGVEPVNIGRARNMVIAAQPPGTELAFIDDDISRVVRRVDAKTLADVTDIDAMFVSGFRDMHACGATLWGVYPVMNPYFMRQRVTHDLRYVIACLFGMRVTGKPHEMVVLDDKEDYERSIRHYLADGTVCRQDFISMQTSYYKEPGGLQLSRTHERIRLSAEWLAKNYPDLCTMNTGKKSPYPEVRLRDRRRA